MDYVNDCLDEIALEGLDGITLEALWLRLKNREPSFSFSLDDVSKDYLWKNVIGINDELDFYELPSERKPLILFNRFEYRDEETGICIEQESTPGDIYPVNVIQKNGICGSCSHYESRVNVTHQVRDNNLVVIKLQEANSRWGSKLVIVASQTLRNLSIFGDNQNTSWHTSLPAKHYCLVERIARSRYHGEVTHGKFSLMESFQENSKTIFYIRKKLSRFKVLKAQTFNQRLIKGINVSGKLLHLNRFFVEKKPIYLGWLEKLSIILEERQNNRDLLTTLKAEMSIKDGPFKKLYQLGSKYVKTCVIPYREFYPDAEPEKYMTKGNQHERTVRVLELIEPYRYKSTEGEEEDEGDTNMDDDEDETQAPGFLKESSKIDQVIEHPLLYQANQFVLSKGEAGCNQMDMYQAFGLGKLEGRLLCRNLEKRGAVKRIMWDEGKQRVQRYVSIKFSDTSDLHTKLEEEKKKITDHRISLSESMIVTPDKKNSNRNEDTPGKTGDESFFDSQLLSTYAHQSTKNAHVTYRMLKRANIILNAVKENRLIDNLYLVQKKIIDLESNEGFNYRIDKKSMMRLISRLSDRGQIKSIKTVVKLESGSRKEERELHFICDPTLSSDDPLVTSAIESAKCKLMAASKESLLKNSKQDATSTQTYAVDVSKPNHALLKSNIRVSDMEYDPEAGKRMGFLPRMKRVQLVHQFLWYLVYGYGANNEGDEEREAAGCTSISPGSGGLRADSSLTDSFLGATEDDDSTELLNKLTIYCHEVSWRRFIPPLPRHTSYMEGWCLIGDVLLLLPVYMFCQIIRINFRIKGLLNYLNDPIKRNIPVCQLPSYIRQCLMYERKYIFCFYEVARLCAELGLLSFGIREFKEKEQIFVYIHKHASVVDTTVPPEDDDKPMKKFIFENIHDVNQYWFTLQFICLNTPLSNLTLGESGSTCNRTTMIPDRFMECLRGKTPQEIIDEGIIPGDGLGAGGIDSNFWAHLKRNWSQASDLDLRVETLVTDPTNVRHVGPKSRVKPKRAPKSEMRGNSFPAKGPKTSRKRKQSAKGSFIDHDEQGSDAASSPTKKYKMIKVPPGSKGSKRSNSTTIVPVPAPKKKKAAKPPKKRAIGYDSKDQAALDRMTMERVNWTSEEDSLLLLCQVTQVFLCGNRRDFIVNYGVIRDIMHSSFEKSKDKTSKACGRRLKYMMKNPQTVLNVNMYVGEAMQDKALVQEFKGPKKYCKTNSAGNEEVFKKVVAKLREKFKSSLYSIKSIELPDTVEELHSKYILSRGQQPRKVEHRDVTSMKDVYFSVLQNLIHSSMLLNDKMGRAHELYQLYNQYPEELLFEVFTSMKNAGIITKVKKNAVNTPVAMGTYQLAQRYNYHWLSRYPKTIFESVQKEFRSLREDFEASQSEKTREFSDTNDCSGSCIVAVTLMAQRKISFKTLLPEQIIVVDSKKMKEDEEKFAKEKEAKKKAGCLSDSDVEEEAMIEEAEKQRQPAPKKKQQTQKPVAANKTPGESSIMFDNRPTASRFLLSITRGQYATSSKNLSPADHLVVNACTVKMQLKPESINKTETILKGANTCQIHEAINFFNHDRTLVHSKTCLMLLKAMRKTQPARVHFPAVLKLLQSKHDYSADELDQVSKLNEFIQSSGFIGAKVEDIKARFATTPKLKLYIGDLIEHQVVLKVGVTVSRLVSHQHARPWLIYSYKNTKGRGSKQCDDGKDEDATIQLPIALSPAEISKQPETSSSPAETTSDSIQRSPIGACKQSIGQTGIERSEIALRNNEGTYSNQQTTPSSGSVCSAHGSRTVGQNPSNLSMVSPPPVSRTVSTESTKITQQEECQINFPNPAAPYERPSLPNDPEQGSPKASKMPATSASLELQSRNETDISEKPKLCSNTKAAITSPTKPMPLIPVKKSNVSGAEKARETNRSLHKSDKTETSETTYTSETCQLAQTSVTAAAPCLSGRSPPSEQGSSSLSTGAAFSSQLASGSEAASETSAVETGNSLKDAVSNVQIRLKAPDGVANQALIQQVQQMIASGQLGSLQPGSKIRLRMPLETTSAGESPVAPPKIISTSVTTSDNQHETPIVPDAGEPTDSMDVEKVDSSSVADSGQGVPPQEQAPQLSHQMQPDNEGQTLPDSKDEKEDTKTTEKKSTSRQPRIRTSIPAKVVGAPPKATGTYQRVRLICRPWRTPEGTVNRNVLKMMLESILLYIMAKPGLTKKSLEAKYSTTLQPVPLLEIIEILQKLGCVSTKFIRKTSKPTLFSSRRKYQIADGEDESDEMTITPTVDCLLKLSQFLEQMQTMGTGR